MRHLVKSRNALTYKFFVNHLNSFVFIDHIKLIDLEGLFKKTLFNFNYVAIVPGKKGDFAGLVWNFFDDSHRTIESAKVTNLSPNV